MSTHAPTDTLTPSGTTSQPGKPLFAFIRVLTVLILLAVVARTVLVPGMGGTAHPVFFLPMLAVVALGMLPWVRWVHSMVGVRRVTGSLFALTVLFQLAITWHVGLRNWWGLPVVMGTFATFWVSLGQADGVEPTSGAARLWRVSPAQWAALGALAAVWLGLWWVTLNGPGRGQPEPYFMTRLTSAVTALVLTWMLLLGNLSVKTSRHHQRYLIGQILLGITFINILTSNLWHEPLSANSTLVSNGQLSAATVLVVVGLMGVNWRVRHRAVGVSLIYAVGMLFMGLTLRMSPAFASFHLIQLGICWGVLLSPRRWPWAVAGWCASVAVFNLAPGVHPTFSVLLSLSGTLVFALTLMLMRWQPQGDAVAQAQPSQLFGMLSPNFNPNFGFNFSSKRLPQGLGLGVGLAVPVLGLAGVPGPSVALMQAMGLLGLLLGYLSFVGARAVNERAELHKQQADFEQMQVLMNATTTGLRVFDETGRNVFANDAISALSKYPMQELLKQNLFTHPIFQKMGLGELAKEVLATGVTKTHTYVGKHTFGHDVAVRRTFSRIHFNGQPMLLMQVDDLATEYALRAQLQEKLTDLEDVIEGTQVGTFKVDVDKDEGVWNEHGVKMLGYSCAEFNPHTAAFYESLIHPDDAAQMQEIRTLHLQGKIPLRHVEYRIRHKAGHYLWVMERSRVTHRHADGSASILSGTTMDITAIKETEAAHFEARQAAERAEAAKTRFLSNMSHEMRTPLNGLLGFNRLLADTPLDNQQRHFVQRSITAGQQLLELINDVLDFSKLQDGAFQLNPSPMRPVNVMREALSLVQPMAEAKGLNLRVQLAKDDSQALWVGDAQRLRQIFLNLLSNAVKFTDQGSITFKAQSCPDMPDALCFEVTDTGKGIAPEDQAKLFQRFSQINDTQTRQQQGTGLGLAIVKGLAEQMGGRVSVHSELGKGTTFSVYVTLSRPTEAQMDEALTNDGLAGAGVQAPPAPASSLEAAQTKRLQGVRLLLVDDSEMNIEVASALLAKEGAQVHSAENGQVALDVLATHGQWMDMVLMDISMPVMDGCTAAKAIRGSLNLERLPILAMSANASHEDQQAALTCGMNGYVIKPFDPDDLVGQIRAQVMAYRGEMPQRSHA